MNIAKTRNRHIRGIRRAVNELTEHGIGPGEAIVALATSWLHPDNAPPPTSEQMVAYVRQAADVLAENPVRGWVDVVD